MNFEKFKYFLAAFLAAAIWGFFSIALRNLKEYPSDEILHYRIFTSLLITWLIILLFRRDKIKSDIAYLRSLTSKDCKKLYFLTFLAGILITGNWFSFIYAVNHVSLKSAAFAYMVCPLITALGSFFILKEHLSLLKLLAISIAILSITILARGFLYDVLWSVFIAIFYAFYLIIQRIITKIDKLNMLGIQLAISTLLMFPLYIYHFSAFPTDFSFWFNILIISILFTIIPLFLSLYALIGLASSTVGIIIYLNPIVAFAVAFFYFHEVITSYQLFAYCLLLVAVIVFNWSMITELFLKRARQGEDLNLPIR